MTAKPLIRVLVVDDSAFMRKALKGILDEDPGIVVIDVARDGIEAVEKVERLKPDVVTLDIEMPRMDGLEALRLIMERHPVPVLMVSSLVEEGAEATLEALEIGALDFVPKHLDDLSYNIFKIKEDLKTKIKALATNIHKMKARAASRGARPKPTRRIGEVKDQKFVSHGIAIVAIGASTGGPKAVQDIVQAFPVDFPAGVVVIIHMPANFSKLFADRLNAISDIEVAEARGHELIQPGVVLVAPGGAQMKLRKRAALETEVYVDHDPLDAIYKPSVDISLASVAECFPGRALGVILTGMGADGREGIRAIKKTGGKVLAQDEESCVVYGMPKAIADDGLSDKIVPLGRMASEILNMV